MVTIASNPLGSHLLEALPKGNTFDTEYYCVTILTQLLTLRQRVDGRDSLFMLTTQDPTPLQNTERFTEKIRSASPYTHRTHPIICLDPPILFPFSCKSFGLDRGKSKP
jgi:hypothetical protein